jgi:hypothetical protein
MNDRGHVNPTVALVTELRDFGHKAIEPTIYSVQRLLPIVFKREARLVRAACEDSSIGQLMSFGCMPAAYVGTSHHDSSGAHTLLECHMVEMGLHVRWYGA